MKKTIETSPHILESLVCPIYKTKLRYDAKTKELLNDKAGLAYPIQNGIPIMVADRARPIDDK